MLTGALIGVGRVARNGHLPGWRARPEVTFLAAADSRDEGREAFLDAYPQARWYHSPEDLLAAERPDFADVCTPPVLHAPMARAALSAGCHVLCEKPLTIFSEDIEPLVGRAREENRALVTVHNWKHAPALAKITDLVAAGAIGRISSVRWETLRTQPAAAAGSVNWRADPALSGGGVLVDHGWHAFYALRQWLPGRPRTLTARLETRRHREFALEDTADVSLDWGGARAQVFLTWAADRRGNGVEIRGDRGSLALDGGRLELSSEAGARESWELPSIAEGSHHPEWFEGVIEEFLAEVGDPAARGKNLEEAVLCATLIARAQESSRGGGATVPVPLS